MQEVSLDDIEEVISEAIYLYQEMHFDDKTQAICSRAKQLVPQIAQQVLSEIERQKNDER